MNIVRTTPTPEMEPLSCNRSLLECQVAGSTLEELHIRRFSKTASYLKLGLNDIFWPSDKILATLAAAKNETVVKGKDGEILAWASVNGECPEKFETLSPDEESIQITYPWDILAINEQVVGNLSENRIDGVVRENVTIDGHVEIGEGTVLLPGVYIEGNVIIGKNCKIGPNCYFRGNTSVGDNCHVGQAVEIKNSIIMDGVSAGHLTYIGDSIIGKHTNLGAGTITANFRHDGRNHRSDIDGELVDTGRRKLGCVMGDHVHTGIHTSIYPGRKIWPDKETRPGDIVKKDVK